ncbi:MAG: acyltransferase family protein [Microbacterium gubbeenense]|uniref:acyltransferase family protein n=1 Tax=Microbacterium gubbeenense TaxID=159896 RepID=UPI003F9C73E0
MKREFRTDIQGMRAIAVLLVVIYHAGVSVLSGGFIGVDVFFVISGFLITTHLVESVAEGRFKFGAFYARRVRRLLPAAIVVIIITMVIALLWFPPLTVPEMMTEAVATAAYVPNFLFAWRGTDYLAGSMPSIFQHYWSLGVEEQFYLAWPVLVVLAFALFKGSRKGLIAVIAIVTASSFLLGFWMTEWRQPWAFFLLPARAWQLGVGGLLAVAVLSMPGLRKARVWKDLLAWAGVGTIVLLGFAFTETTPYPSWRALLPTLAAAAVILGGSGSGAFGPTRLLSIAPIQFVGRISYSLYLVHWPLIVAPQYIVGWDRSLPLWATLLLGAAAVPTAWLSWRFIEEPGRSGKRWWSRSTRRSLFGAVAAAALVAATAIPASAMIERQALDADKPASSTELSLNPVGTSFVPNNLTPNLRDATSDNPAIYENRCHLDYGTTMPANCEFGDNPTAARVVLFGDSHAATWFPALKQLADDGDILLVVHTKSACASANIKTHFANGTRYEECDTWRSNVIHEINNSSADLVIFANYTSSNLDDTTDWATALTETIESLHGEISTIVVEDTPHHKAGPAICLSQHLDDAKKCAPPAASVIDDSSARFDRLAAERTDSSYLSINDYLCGDVCPAIIGDTLVYRDSSHLTATMSRKFASIFKSAIGEEVSVDARG